MDPVLSAVAPSRPESTPVVEPVGTRPQLDAESAPALPRETARRGLSRETLRADDEVGVRKAAEALQEELKTLGNLRVRFGYDEDTSRYVVEFLDPEEDEVVRQIPPEALLHSIRRLREIRSVLFDGKS